MDRISNDDDLKRDRRFTGSSSFTKQLQYLVCLLTKTRENLNIEYEKNATEIIPAARRKVGIRSSVTIRTLTTVASRASNGPRSGTASSTRDDEEVKRVLNNDRDRISRGNAKIADRTGKCLNHASIARWPRALLSEREDVKFPATMTDYLAGSVVYG